jgi:hypothetical protein
MSVDGLMKIDQRLQETNNMNPKAVCAHCGKQYQEHYPEKYKDGYTNTNGDTFSGIPSDETILDMILEGDPDLYQQCLDRWLLDNGHIE